MTRTFIQTDEFTKNWERLGLTNDDLRRLELEIMKNPKVGPVIQGTGKLRKMRFAFENSGKSEKDNLSKAERNEIKKFIDILEKSLGGNDNE